MKIKKLLQIFLSSYACFVILDYLWFSVVSGKFLFQKMRPIANTNSIGEAFSITYWSATIVYALLSLGMIYLVQPEKQESYKDAALAGSLYGLVVYGVYDFTNYATLEYWPLDLMAVDVVWGTFSACLISILVYKLFRVNRS